MLKKIPTAPEVMQRCRSLLNLEKFEFSTEDLLKMPLKPHAEHLCFIERVGSFLWNTFSEKPAPHIRGWANQTKRQAVNVYGSKHDELKKGWCMSLTNDPKSELVGWLAPATEALPTLVTWLRLRPALFNAVGSMTCVDQAHFEGHKIQSGTESLRADGCGYWWRLELDTRPVAKRTIGWHATSFYCLQRVVLEGGPREGFAENDEKGKTVKGVFYMRGPQAHCCDNYLHYVMLDDDGWLFAPVLQMAVDEDGMQATGKKTCLKRGQEQKITDPEFLELRAVYVHMVHISHLYLRPRSEWVTAEPGFHPALEIDPLEPWETILKRSKERRYQAFTVEG